MTVPACAGTPGVSSRTWQPGPDPSVVTPGPSRCTVPASGPPTTRSSATPPGSASEVAAAARSMVVTTAPSRSARAAGVSGGTCCPPTHSTGPRPASPTPSDEAARGCMITGARCSFGAKASWSASATCPAVAPSSPLTITSAGPCGVRAVSAIRIRLLQCYPGTPAPRAPLGCAGSCSCSAASAAMLSNFTSRLREYAFSAVTSPVLPPREPAKQCLCARRLDVREGPAGIASPGIAPCCRLAVTSAVTPAPRGQAAGAGRITACRNPRHEGCNVTQSRAP